MGQKVHPHGLRIGVIKEWDAKWYADKKNFANYLIEDNKIRKYIMSKEKLSLAGISKIEIERASKRIRISIHTAKPGMVIGKGGQLIEELKKELSNLVSKDDRIKEISNHVPKDNREKELSTLVSKDNRILINIIEIKNAEIDAQLVAENIAAQLKKRISFRRAMKQAIQRTMKSGAKGIKTACSGRLGGAEIARSEYYHEGTIPLQTLRADIDYGFAEADTTYGKIGVKVWIYKGEVLPVKKDTENVGTADN